MSIYPSLVLDETVFKNLEIIKNEELFSATGDPLGYDVAPNGEIYKMWALGSFLSRKIFPSSFLEKRKVRIRDAINDSLKKIKNFFWEIQPDPSTPNLLHSLVHFQKGSSIVRSAHELEYFTKYFDFADPVNQKMITNMKAVLDDPRSTVLCNETILSVSHLLKRVSLFSPPALESITPEQKTGLERVAAVLMPKNHDKSV